MTLDTVIMLAGGFVAVLPFLQLPPSWITPLSFIAGVVIIGLGVVVRRNGARCRMHRKETHEHFVDATPKREE